MATVAATSRVERVSLTDAAPQLGGYSRAWALLMRGSLDGERRGGRWYVSEASIERVKAASARDATA